jgi:hypothetical protein
MVFSPLNELRNNQNGRRQQQDVNGTPIRYVENQSQQPYDD